MKLRIESSPQIGCTDRQQNVPKDKTSQGQNGQRKNVPKDKTSYTNYQAFKNTFCFRKLATYVR